MADVIEAIGLTKTYGSRRGITELDLRVQAGEIFGYLGPNGSGKTTTIRLMLGFVHPDRGQVRLFGKKSGPGAVDLRSRIGYVPGEASLPEQMSGHTALRFFERLSGRGAPNRQWLCSQLHLQENELRRSIRTLSRGTKQKIAIVQALQHDPELIILDEPTTGLDPLSQEAFFDLLHDLRDRGRTIFFSSHVLSEVQRLADRVAVLRDGMKVLESTMMEMAARADRLLWIKMPGATPPAGIPRQPENPPATASSPPIERPITTAMAAPHPAIEGARFIRRDAGGWLLYLLPAGNGQQVLEKLTQIKPIDFRFEPALEESFLKLYGVQVRSLQSRGNRP